MDVLSRYLTLDECIQCAAETILGADPADFEAGLIAGLEKSQGWQLGRSIAGLRERVPEVADAMKQGMAGVGAEVIEPGDKEAAVRVARRSARLACRTILLEPHECGKSE